MIGWIILGVILIVMFFVYRLTDNNSVPSSRGNRMGLLAKAKDACCNYARRKF